MPSFEEEAFERARKMSRGRRAPNEEKPKKPAPEKSEKPAAVKAEQPAAPKAEKPQVSVVPQKPAPNMLETLFKDKETSLILMLLLLLMDEKNDPTLIFSLMYLLM